MELIHPYYEEVQKENHNVIVPWRAAERPKLAKNSFSMRPVIPERMGWKEENKNLMLKKFFP